jgi:hypothetical protein
VARGGVTKLTITHDVTGAPKLAALLAGEWESGGAGGGWVRGAQRSQDAAGDWCSVAFPERLAEVRRAAMGRPSEAPYCLLPTGPL